MKLLVYILACCSKHQPACYAEIWKNVSHFLLLSRYFFPHLSISCTGLASYEVLWWDALFPLNGTFSPFHTATRLPDEWLTETTLLFFTLTGGIPLISLHSAEHPSPHFVISSPYQSLLPLNVIGSSWTKLSRLAWGSDWEVTSNITFSHPEKYHSQSSYHQPFSELLYRWKQNYLHKFVWAWSVGFSTFFCIFEKILYNWQLLVNLPLFQHSINKLFRYLL